MLLHACKHYIKLIVVRIRISSYSTAQLQRLTPIHANYTFPLDKCSRWTQLEYSSFQHKSNSIFGLQLRRFKRIIEYSV